MSADLPKGDGNDEFQEALQPVIIKLPEDQQWQALLRTKQQQYRDRLARAGEELAMYKDPLWQRRTGNGYRIRLIDELFSKGELNTWDIWRSISGEQGDDFHPQRFNSSLEVIYVYSTNQEFLVDSINNPGQKKQAPGVITPTD